MPEARWRLSLELPGLKLPEHPPVLRAAQEAGYTDAWPGEVSGHDGFTPVAAAATCTDRMRLGTGVVNAFTRGPAVLAQHAAALQELSEGRFCLGIGSSSNVIVERWNGIPFERPLSRVRETVEFLRAALAGERAGQGRFKLDPPGAAGADRDRGPAERMLHMAGELGDGAFVNFVPLAAAERVVDGVRQGERAAGKEPGSTEVLCRFFCMQGDPEEALGMARFMFCAYATVPVYEKFFRWLGYGEAIDPLVEAWRAGDRGRAVELAPRELIEDIFVLRDAAAQRRRLRDYVERGITTPILLTVPPPGQRPTVDGYVELVDSLAPST